MTILRLACFATMMMTLVAVSTAQEPKKTAEDPTPGKFRGQLPFYWKDLGLTEEQRQKVYKINADYNEQIDALELKIKELKSKRDKERFEILSPEQKKALEKIIRDKIGG